MACRTMARVAANPHQAEIANGPEPNLPNSCLGLKSERFLAAAEAAAIASSGRFCDRLRSEDGPRQLHNTSI